MTKFLFLEKYGAPAVVNVEYIVSIDKQYILNVPIEKFLYVIEHEL